MSIMDEKGKVVKEGAVSSQREVVLNFLTKAGCDGSSAAVLETSHNWPVMYDWLEELVAEVHLAHPLKVKAIAEAKIKTDKIDARVLAHLLRCDLLPEAYVTSPEARQVRKVLRQRMFFVRLRTMVKNRVSGLLDRYPQLSEQKPCQDIFSQKGLSWLRQIPIKEVDKRLLEEDLKLYEALKECIAKSDSLVRELAQSNRRVELLKTIPGIGDFFSVLVAYEVDIRRFATEKKFFSYIGIIPYTLSSSSRTFHGRLTKQGNKYLRRALVDAIWPAIEKDAQLRAYYEKVKLKKGANPAKIATARRLATIIYRVLYQERPYNVYGLRLSSYRHGGPK